MYLKAFTGCSQQNQQDSLTKGSSWRRILRIWLASRVLQGKILVHSCMRQKTTCHNFQGVGK